MTWIPRVLVVLAAAAALLASRRDPRCLSVASALLASTIIDSLRVLCSPPYEVALALYLAPLAIGAWVTLRVLCGRLASPASAVAVAYCAALVAVPRGAQPAVVLCCCVAVELVVAGSFLRDGRARRASERAALVLVAGDVLGALGPAGPLPWPRSWSSSAWLAAAQASLAALGVAVAVWSRWDLRTSVECAKDRPMNLGKDGGRDNSPPLTRYPYRTAAESPPPPSAPRVHRDTVAAAEFLVALCPLLFLVALVVAAPAAYHAAEGSRGAAAVLLIVSLGVLLISVTFMWAARTLMRSRKDPS